VDRPRFIRAENAHWHDGHERFGDDQTETRLRRLEFTVRTSLAFGKNERPLACSQDSDQSLERGPVLAAFRINRDDI